MQGATGSKGPRLHSSARGQRNHGCLKTICSLINSTYLRSFLVWRAAKPRTVSSNLFRFSPTCAKVSQPDSYRIYGFCNGNVLWTWRRCFFSYRFIEGLCIITSALRRFRRNAGGSTSEFTLLKQVVQTSRLQQSAMLLIPF